MKFRIDEKSFLICLLCYFVSRLYGLTLLPIFIDEGVHIQRATEIWGGGLRSILTPLIDGKALQIWLNALVVPWFLNTLWVSRFINVLAGTLTLWGCYKIGTLLFNKVIGLISAGLYIICPFTLFYDRVALSDGILSTFSTLTLLWSIWILKDPRKEYIWLLAASIVLGILAKMSGIVLLLTPLLVYFFLFRGKDINPWRYLGKVYLLVIVFSAIPVCIFIWKTTQITLITILASSSTNLLSNLSHNVKMAFEWVSVYWTQPIMILGMIGFIMALIRKQHESILLASLVLLPIILLAGIARIWFPRYILFSTVPFLILVSWSMVKFKGILESWVMKIPWRLKRFHVGVTLGLLFFAVTVFSAGSVDYYFWTDPSYAPLPRIEYIQYIEEWPSGYGVKEAAKGLLEESGRHPEGIMVIYHEFSDNSHFGLGVYLMKEPKINLQYLNLNKPESFLSLSRWASNYPTFVVLSRPGVGERREEQADLERLLSIAALEHSYPKPGGRRFIEVYRVQGH
jgi:hypothetical protein